MGTLVLDNTLMNLISSLANRLKTTKEEIVKKAVMNYQEKVAPKNRLMELSGTLGDDDAKEILDTIYTSRQNKEMSPYI